MRWISIFVFTLAFASLGSDELLLCGGSEVFLLRAGSAEKIWSWRAAERPELPAAIAKLFGSTDDCRPIDGGKRILISSSGGAVALVERPSGRVLFYARVPNAHGVELLPHGKIVAAASTHAKGNRLMLFDKERSDEVLWEDPLHSAHGVVWDEKRKRLWAIGFNELRAYSLVNFNSRTPALKLEVAYSLPDDNGHDLSSVPGSDEMIVTTHHHVYVFSRDKETFRLHSELGARENTKGVSVHPRTGRTVFVQAEGKNWWAATLHFLAPEASVPFPGERLYRPRWLDAPK